MLIITFKGLKMIYGFVDNSDKAIEIKDAFSIDMIYTES